MLPATLDHPVPEPTCPTLAEVGAILAELHGPASLLLWRRLLERAALTGEEGGGEAVQRLLDAMADCDSLTRLCERALRVRLLTHQHLVQRLAAPAPRRP